MTNLSPNAIWQFDVNYWFKNLNSSAEGLSEQAANQILQNTGDVNG